MSDQQHDNANLQARLATLERSIESSRARSDLQFDRLFAQLATQKAEAARTSARVAGIIGLLAFVGSVMVAAV